MCHSGHSRRVLSASLCPVDAPSPGPTGSNPGATADPRLTVNADGLDSWIDSSIIAAPADRNQARSTSLPAPALRLMEEAMVMTGQRRTRLTAPAAACTAVLAAPMPPAGRA